MTSGGIYGKVVDLKETVVTLEVAPNVRIRVHRPQISAVLPGRRRREGREGLANAKKCFNAIQSFSASPASWLFIAPISWQHVCEVEIPDWWTDFLPSDEIHLGLDLQGGSHLVLEVKVDKAIEKNGAVEEGSREQLS